MKIDFVCRSQNISVGTYRILVKDLSEVLKSQGHDVKIHDSPQKTRSDAVVIYSKGDVSLYNHNPADDRVFGAISLSGDSTQRFHFSIVNSVEEKKSVEHLCEETVIINLEEMMYKNCKRKTHIETQEFTVGYHGSYTHLPKLRGGFVSAFRHMLKVGVDMKFACLSNDSRVAETILKEIDMPMEFVRTKNWTYDCAKDFISMSDVGVLPNLTSNVDPHILSATAVMRDGTYNTDYVYRFKNKSNPGRSFVFIQLGIPVITDLTPSMMPLYHDETCGAVATNEYTWIKAFQRFMDSDERNRAAAAAYERFIQLYSMERDAIKLVEAIERIKK